MLAASSSSPPLSAGQAHGAQAWGHRLLMILRVEHHHQATTPFWGATKMAANSPPGQCHSTAQLKSHLMNFSLTR